MIGDVEGMFSVFINDKEDTEEYTLYFASPDSSFTDCESLEDVVDCVLARDTVYMRYSCPDTFNHPMLWSGQFLTMNNNFR